jgi:metal-responsive CopG/Arc/MetJ family transcriptional regulator
MPSKKPFLGFVVKESLLKKIDDFRFENRFESRAAAIKWLLEEALKRGIKP